MPVHAPSSRLLSSIPFKHIGKGLGAGGSKEVNAALNVTPFVDMMTILVTFLLMVFSSTGQLVSAQRGLQLPDATNKDRLRQAPVLIVTQDAVTFQGEQMADTRQIEEDESNEVKIIELYDRLKQERTAFKMSFDTLPQAEKDRCARDAPPSRPEDICLDGLLILQADKNISAKVLNRVIMTAYATEYKNIMFAVNRRAR
jgi:biopolymer transport protein ExbD